LAVIIAVPLASHFIILAMRHIPLGLHPGFGGWFKLGFVTVSALTHWSIYAALLAGFALTLRPGHEPLITAMARRMHGLTPEMIRYTRKVTIAWSLFFAAQLAISVSLFCFAPLTVWSFFVNVLDIPLVAAMFAAEYAVRLRVLDDPPRHSIGAIIEMVMNCFPSAAETAPAPPLAAGVEPDVR
jgi:hypothetical protein